MSVLTQIRPRPSVIDNVDRGLRRFFENEVSSNLLTRYWYKPGIAAAFTAYMRNTSGGSGIISSTAHATKGFVYLGSSTGLAFDETNTRVGINKAVPTARLHISDPLSGATELLPGTDNGACGVSGCVNGFYHDTPPPDARVSMGGDILNNVFWNAYRNSSGNYNHDIAFGYEAVTSDNGFTSTLGCGAANSYCDFILNGSVTTATEWSVKIVARNFFGGTLSANAMLYFYVTQANGDVYQYGPTDVSGLVSGAAWTEVTFSNPVLIATGGTPNAIRMGSGATFTGATMAVTKLSVVKASGGVSGNPLQTWQTDDSVVLDHLTIASDGSSAYDLCFTGTTPLRISAGGGTSGLRMLTSSTNGRLEVGTAAQANMNLVLSGARATTGTLVTLDFTTTTIGAALKLNALTGLLQAKGTTAASAITDSSTVGQCLRVTGAATYAWGALDLADTDAITGDLPYANLTPSTAASRLLGRTSASAGDWQEITLGTGLAMSTTTLSLDTDLSDIAGITRTRGDLIVGGASAWVDLAHPGAAGYAFTTDATDPLWDQTPEWTGLHTWVDVGITLLGVVGAPGQVIWNSTFGGANGNLRLQATPGATTNATITLPNCSGQPPITGSSTAPPTAAQVLGLVNITGRTSDISPAVNLTNLTGSSLATGFFLLSAIITCTVAEAAAGTLTLRFDWTDDGGANFATVTRSMIATGASRVNAFAYVASGNITYNVTGYTNPGGGVTPAYTVRVRVTSLG